MSLVPLSPRLRPRHTAGPIFMMPGSGASPASGLNTYWVSERTSQDRHQFDQFESLEVRMQGQPMHHCRAAELHQRVANALWDCKGGAAKLTGSQRRQPLPGRPLALRVGDERHLARRLQHDGRHTALAVQQLIHVRLCTYLQLSI